MEILTLIWEQYLYIPLFNLLVWLYMNYSMYNLGVAVVLLTILLRIVLLPFTILTERSKLGSDQLAKEIKEIQEDYKNDSVKRKIAIRRQLKKRHVRPWAKAISMSMQLLVFLLLYQVFVGGINTEEKLHLLYPSVAHPDFINTKFLGFNLAVPNLILPGIVAGYIFAEIIISAWANKEDTNRKEHIYSLLFPAFAFLLLAFLPSVKSIFVLTSLVFSSIISGITAIIKLAIKKPEPKASHHH